MHLVPLSARRTTAYEEVTVRITSSGRGGGRQQTPLGEQEGFRQRRSVASAAFLTRTQRIVSSWRAKSECRETETLRLLRIFRVPMLSCALILITQHEGMHMLDNPTKLPITSDRNSWISELSWGDIVSFRFPVDGGGELPKKRPCLVLDTLTSGGKRYAVLAYGTSVRSSSNSGYEVRLGAQDAIEAGLHRATRFIGARRLTVSLDHDGFVAPDTSGNPIIGRLSGSAFDRMNAVRGRIHAETDIAAEHRAERRDRPKPRHRRTQPPEFTVEHRHPPLRKLASHN